MVLPDRGVVLSKKREPTTDTPAAKRHLKSVVPSDKVWTHWAPIHPYKALGDATGL